MSNALNLTLPIKQDAATQEALKTLAERFATDVQPLIAEALKQSKLVHFARVVVIDNRYIQVLTEYEGDHREYTEFFRRALTPVFAAIFSLAEGVPDVSDPDEFWKYAKAHNCRSLGTAADGSKDFDGNPAGWLFSAYDHKSVKEILTKLGQ